MADISPGGTVALGVVVGLISTCIQSVGLTLQRKSHMLEDEKEDDVPRLPPYRRRRWQIGMGLFLISNIVGSSIQITTLPLPLLSTLQASGLVFNAILASLLLHEPFTRRTAFGTILVAGGAVLISLFSALPEPSHTLDQLLQLLVVPNFIVWMSMTLLLVVVIIVGCFFLDRVLPAHKRRTPRIRLLRGMGYGLASGVLSAHSLLLAKSAVELLVRTIVDHTNQFNRYQSWLLLILFLFFALTQLYYLHHGLKLVSTSILYPFVFCVYNIIAILDGLIYFRQMDRLPPLHAGLIALGTVVLLTGVLALSWRLSEHNGEDEDESQFHHGKLDLPQTALTPGMGLVDDHSGSPTALLNSETDDEEASAGEQEPLLRRHTLRDSTLLDARKRRHRRNTVREVADIYSELRDEGNYYESLTARGNDAEEQSVGLLGRRRRLSGAELGPGRPEQKALAKGLVRSKTAPGNNRRRRSTLGIWGRSDADLTDIQDNRKSWASSIKLDWWRRRRRDQESHDGDNEHEREHPDSPET